MNSLAPGSTIGILGGGQLARMLCLAAARLGLKCHIYDPATGPAMQVSDAATVANWDDAAALARFAESVDVVTYEFENIPTAALDAIEALRPLYPGRRALEVSQDRLVEKQFLADLGLAVAPFVEASGPEVIDTVGCPAIFKTRRLGYDGKGQARVAARDDAAHALAALNGAPAIIEGFVDFSCEISVIAARGIDGETVAFDPGRNCHQNGILHSTTVPCGLPASVTTDAVLIASRILSALDYVGVLGVELFVTSKGLVVNEIAPRVHNSGHWTQAACLTCQFEQHIRAVAGWPLGDGKRHADAVMENLLGDDASGWDSRAVDGQLHLYGKDESRVGRKMGHIIRLT